MTGWATEHNIRASYRYTGVGSCYEHVYGSRYRHIGDIICATRTPNEQSLKGLMSWLHECKALAAKQARGYERG